MSSNSSCYGFMQPRKVVPLDDCLKEQCVTLDIPYPETGDVFIRGGVAELIEHLVREDGCLLDPRTNTEYRIDGVGHIVDSVYRPPIYRGKVDENKKSHVPISKQKTYIPINVCSGT